MRYESSSGPSIVIITSSYPIEGNGSEAAGGFVADLAQAMAREIPVKVVAPGITSCVEKDSSRVTVYRFAAPMKALSQLKPYKPVDAWQISRVLRNGQKAALEAARSGEVAHILALWALPCGAWARKVSREISVPYSIWTLGSDIWTLGRIPIVRSCLRQVIADAKYCYSDGIQLKKDTEQISGRAVDFLPSTRHISLKRATPVRSGPPYRLLFIGRWHPNKGIDLLMDSLNMLGHDDWRKIESVHIHGGGPLSGTVETIADALQRKGFPVHVHGYIKKEEAEAALAEADYLLIPSRIESIPVVFSDAMKMGCPVIAMPTGDLPQLIAGDAPCGVVASEISAAAFATAIHQALELGPSSMLEGVNDMARHFDLDCIAKRMLKEMNGNQVGA